MPKDSTTFSRNRSGRWLRAGSVALCLAAVVLLATAFGAHYYSGPVFTVMLALVLAALLAAIALHVRFLLLTRREHSETVSILDATERRYKTVFDSTLDAILILDDQGVCMEANPAALALFGTGNDALVGRSLEKFFAGAADFKDAWKRFLDRKSEHRETRILRGDGGTIFVEYTARAHYLPGRHVAVFRDVTRRKLAEDAQRGSEERFRQMASHIQEIFWMLDAGNRKVLYISPAYETITGRTCESLAEDPKSYEEVIHPEDRVRILSRLDEASRAGQFDEEFRIVRPDGRIRWIWARGFPVRDSSGIIRRLVGTAQDVSARKSAEEQMARNLDMAEAARAEAEAFRRTSLALTQNLSMDYVLETLLQSLAELIPCDSAQVLLVESDTRLFLAREIQRAGPGRRSPKFPATLDARAGRFLLQVLATGSSLLIPDTTDEPGWTSFHGFFHLRSWMCVPLVASGQMLGLLSVGNASPRAFTQEHLRLAKSLAIPASVAIQNARLYERAEIFRAELEQRLTDLQQAAPESGEAHPGKRLSQG
jgi:PAS domain S-box-containing protein